MPHRYAKLIRDLDRALGALDRAREAFDEAFGAALDLDANDPPNVHREDKTGPRLPFKDESPPPRPSSPGRYAYGKFSAGRILRHVISAWDRDPSPEARAKIARVMRRLVDLEIVHEEDLRPYLDTKEPR